MKYMGSKSRISNHILPIILKDRKPDQFYVEPFVGGCNSIDKVDNPRIASDKNKYIIAMWKGLQENRNRPRDIPKELYSLARDVYNGKETSFNHLMEMDDFMVGWIGWMGSYNGRFFDGGYSGHCVGKSKRNYINEQIRNTERQIDKIKGIEFRHCSYNELDIPDNSIIYCDIPYQNTKQYSVSKNFNYDNFWEWCRVMTIKGHQVFISEYNAPDDFESIWQMETTNSMNTTITYKPIEKLFKFKI